MLEHDVPQTPEAEDEEAKLSGGGKYPLFFILLDILGVIILSSSSLSVALPGRHKGGVLGGGADGLIIVGNKLNYCEKC